MQLNGFRQAGIYSRRRCLAFGGLAFGGLAFGVALLVAVMPRSAGCPFCLAPPETWTETLSRADVVLVGEVRQLHLFAQQIKVDVSAETVFRIRRIVKVPEHLSLKGRVSPFQEGATITVQEFVTAKPGELFLLTGQLLQPENEVSGTGGSSERSTNALRHMQASAGIAEFTEWDSPAAMNPALLQYVIDAPAADQPAVERLPWFLQYLESSDPEIASDAWGEFARSPYEDVVAVREHLPVDRLRQWIADPATSPERLGLYGMMLGLCGDASDAEFLEQQIGTPQVAKDFRFGSDGLMGGYLLLTGDAGLRFLETTRFREPGVSADEIFSAIQAIQFIWSYEPDLIPRSCLRRSLHVLLDNDQMREVVITDLARWRDWDTAPALLRMFDSLESRDQRSRKAIVAFMIALTRSQSEEGAAPEILIQAHQFLEQVGVEHPVILQAAQREFGPVRE